MLKAELPGLQVTVPTDGLGLVKFGRKVIRKNKSLVDEIELLQKAVSNEKALREGVEKELAQLKESVAASDALSAKLAQSEESLRVVRVEVNLLKDPLARADVEKADFEKLVAEVRTESEQRLVRLNVALVGRGRAEKLTHLIVTQSVSAVDAVIQQLGYDAVSSLRQGLERAFCTVRVPCPVALTSVAGAAANSVRWKGDEGGSENEAEPSE